MSNINEIVLPLEGNTLKSESLALLPTHRTLTKREKRHDQQIIRSNNQNYYSDGWEWHDVSDLPLTQPKVTLPKCHSTEN